MALILNECQTLFIKTTENWKRGSRPSMGGIESIKSGVKLILSFAVAAVNFGVPPAPKSSGVVFRVDPRVPEGFSQYSPSTFGFHLPCALATKGVSPLYTLAPRPMLTLLLLVTP